MNSHETVAFEIPQAESRRCLVYEYTASHRTLKILVHPPPDTLDGGLWVVFQGVEYFAGVMSWTGAAFRLSNENEFSTLMGSLGKFSGIPISDIAKALKLFIVRGTMLPKGGVCEIRILAMKGTISREEIPQFAR